MPSSTTADLFSRGSIDVVDATENNLKHVSLRIPKHRLSVFVGLSGSGKSSLVFDTVAATSRRELNETFPSFTQQYLPKYGQPHVGAIENLPVAIVVEQRRIGANARSTLATYTGIHSLLRLLFSRVGAPFVGYSDVFSFNLPQGMCPRCEGLGTVDEIEENRLLDTSKSLNEGAITFVSFGPGTWRWRRYVDSGLFDNDRPVRDFSPEQRELLLHAPQQKLTDAPPAWHRTALYEGLVPRIRRSIVNSKEGEHHKEALAAIVTHRVCPECHGARLNQKSLSCRINGRNIAEVSALDLQQAMTFLGGVDAALAQDVVRELTTKVGSLVDIGLDYLTLDRQTDTLSGGEAQRIKIAKFLTSSLSDLVYVLDEPTVGLHPHDVQLVTHSLRRLQSAGNTALIVEHNAAVMAIADYIVELGPAAGDAGGEVTFTGSYPELLASDTLTARWLRQPRGFRTPRTPTSMLSLAHVTRHNLHDVSVEVPLGVLTTVTGVAGSGKSSLMAEVRARLADAAIDLSQSPAGVNIRSTPVTYLDVLGDIRKRFAKASGASATLFSYNGGGACPLCKGKGVTITNMAFMDPVVQICEKCGGTRYSDEALAHRYHDRTIAEVLALRVTQASEFFADAPEIFEKLHNLDRVGLGYLALDQALTTLSGGELQRLRLAVQLGRTGEVYLLDEPTAGLHMQDTHRLVALFNELVDAGNSVLLIEHNLEVLTQSDWLIDIGPDAGVYGGQVLFSGPPEEILHVPGSHTAEALRDYVG